MRALDIRRNSIADHSGPGVTLVCAVLAVVLILTVSSASRWYPHVTFPSRQGTIPKARLSEQASLRTVGPRDAALSVADGHDLLTAYEGPAKLQRALAQNEAQALSLASADFDEDGVPDLVSGYAYDGRGIITVHRGNVDSIYPNAPEAKRRKADGTF